MVLQGQVFCDNVSIECVCGVAGGRCVGFKAGCDGQPWVWVMGEHKDDRSIEEIIEAEQQSRASTMAEEEAELLRYITPALVLLVLLMYFTSGLVLLVLLMYITPALVLYRGTSHVQYSTSEVLLHASFNTQCGTTEY